MNRLQRAAVITELADRLRNKGSWCGETHLQKAAYFLQELVRVPTGFAFILYKFGPYSFDLGDELTALRADGLMEIRVKHPEYGASLISTPASVGLRDRFQITLRRYESRLEFVADSLGQRGVSDLERLATALYVTREDGAATTARDRARRLSELKSHVSPQLALVAVEELDRLADQTAIMFPEE